MRAGVKKLNQMSKRGPRSYIDNPIYIQVAYLERISIFTDQSMACLSSQK